ncbi:MAG: MFS transporter [Chloroflexota bacterium]
MTDPASRRSPDPGQAEGSLDGAILASEDVGLPPPIVEDPAAAVDAIDTAAMTGTAASEGGRSWVRPFVFQLIIAALSVTAINAIRPMITYRVLELGGGTLEIGLVVSSFSVLPVLTAVAIGRWIDSVGEGRFLVAAMAMVSLGGLLITFAPALLPLAIGYAIIGFGQIGYLVAGQVMIANRAPRARREDLFGWYSTVTSVGQLVGPAVAGLLVVGSLSASTPAVGGTGSFGQIAAAFAGNAEAPVFLFAAAAAAVACLLALRLPPTGQRGRGAEAVATPATGLARAAIQIFRQPGMTAAMLVSITVISSVDVLVAYLPAYGDANGIPVETVALLLSVRAGSSLVSRLFMTRLIAVLGRERLLGLSMALAGAGVVVLPFVSPVPVLFGLMVVIGLGLGVGQPLTIAWVANRSPRSERGLALGVRLTGNRAALLVVPTVMGAVAGATGLTAIWLLLAAFLGAGALIAVRAPFDELATSGPRERTA